VKRRGLVATAVWLALLIAGGIVISRARFTADLSAFLPQAPTQEQQVLVDQLRDGALSRLILVGIEGADATTRAALSADLAQRLRTAPEFSSISNGEAAFTPRDRELLFADRYLLSPSVTAERFTVKGLHEAIADSIDLLASPAGLMLKTLLPRDPTGELTQLLTQLGGSAGAATRSDHGVWVSRDGSRAILLAQTSAAGFDTDGQERAIDLVRRSFAASQHGDAATGARLMLSGPAVFAVSARQTIRDEAIRLSTLSATLIVLLLSFAYRSLRALLLGLLPVVSGAVAGIAAVSLGFGTVHGLTLGFGTTLIGEAVDYSIYLFVQTGSTEGDRTAWREHWIAAFWPTVRLGMLTSIVGFATLLFSGFPGLAQLGLYSVAGVATAALVTRFVLPDLLPSGFRIRGLDSLGRILSAISRQAIALRWILGGLLVIAVAVIGAHRDSLWNDNLAALSPIDAADQALDASLRADLGAPDARYLVVVSADDSEGALVAAEQVGHALQGAVDKGALGGFETPARYLPSVAMQSARQTTLPDRSELSARLDAATAGLPLRAARLAPFLADVETARSARPLRRADLDGMALALAVDSLLVRQNGHWSALMPLRAPIQDGQAKDIDVGAVRAALAQAGSARALFVDMKAESDRLYAGYLNEAVKLSLTGVAVILVLLLLILKSPARVVRVMAPLAAAVLVVIAGLLLAGVRMNILHLVGMLLIVAVGSNYALFFDREAGASDVDSTPTLSSLVLANLTTVAGFGLLAFSRVPVLQAIGATVGPGAVLALLFAAILAKRPSRVLPNAAARPESDVASAGGVSS
jgi:predicted exporter